MAQQIINNSEAGSSVRSKINTNFTDLYTNKLDKTGNGSTLTGLTKAQVGLANVDNTSDVNKPISTAQQTALDLKLDDTQATATGLAVLGAVDASAARTAIGAGTSSFDGAYSTLTGKPTLGTASPLNVPAAGDATAGEVVKGSDTRLSDARTPLAHNQTISTITGLQTAIDGKLPYTGAAGDTDTGTHNVKVNAILLNNTPAVPTAVGSTYWDDIAGSPATVLNANVTCTQIGETLKKVYNGTGATILNGSLVYQSGVQGVTPSVTLAKADTLATSYVLGMATQDILDGQSGYINTGGEVHELNTNSYSINTMLYLSATTAGAFTSTPPDRAILIGSVQVSSLTVGIINVQVSAGMSLSSLTDTSVIAPSTGQILAWNGTSWVNSPANAVSAGVGVNFYNDDTAIIGATTDNVNKIDTLLRYPNTVVSEVVDAYPAINGTVLGEAYLDGTLGRTLIDAGTWSFYTWCSVSSVSGGRVSSLTRNINQVIVGIGTLTTAGTGTSRTATITAGTPFVAGDASATMTNASYLQTPKGLYQITAYTSSSIVTIAVPATYANEVGASYSKWKKLFGVNTGTITSLTTNYQLITSSVAQPSFVINATDKLGSIVFAISTNTTTVNFLHNGSLRYSYFASPLATSHQDLSTLQGGSANERYHSTAAEHTVATQAANGSQNGFLSLTDWATFNAKAPTNNPVFTGALTTTGDFIENKSASAGSPKTYNTPDIATTSFYDSTPNAKRYYDIAPIGAQDGGSNGGSVIRLITNPNSQAAGIVRARIEASGQFLVGSEEIMPASNSIPAHQITGLSVASNDPDGGTAGVFSNSGYGINKGSATVYGAKYGTAGSIIAGGRFRIGKENATDGNYSTYAAIDTRADGGLLTEKLRIWSDGRISGTGLHNSAGAITGTTNQFIASGTYTPTLENDTNIAASAAEICQYMRVGNVVTVSGRVGIQLTTANAKAYLLFSLPIASALTDSSSQAGGYASNSSATGGFTILPQVGKVNFASMNIPNTVMNYCFFSFTYLIV